MGGTGQHCRAQGCRNHRPRPSRPRAAPYLAAAASARPGFRGRCAPVRFAAVPAESARGGPGTGGGPGGRRDWGEGSGPPPSALRPPRPPTGSSRRGGKSRRCSLHALPVPRAAPTCRVRGRVGVAPSADADPSKTSRPASYLQSGQAALGPRDRAPGLRLVTCRPLSLPTSPRGPASAPGRPPVRKVWGWAPWPRSAP